MQPDTRNTIRSQNLEGPPDKLYLFGFLAMIPYKAALQAVSFGI